jgi:hypothetical protein
MIYRIIAETVIQGAIIWLVKETINQYKKDMQKRKGKSF